jgi:hypothetical protein
MNTTKLTLALALAAAFALGLVWGQSRSPMPAAHAQVGGAQGGGAQNADDRPTGARRGASPRYTVLDTEGTNLLVTDNQTNTFYYYTVDKDQPVGSELKLRGTLDLNEVGQPAITPKPHGDRADREED